MIFYSHFVLLTSGLSATNVLLGVFLRHYTDASQGEIGVLLMTFPFVSIIMKPLFCSMADRHQSHRNYLIVALLVLLVGFSPFVIVPYFPNFYTREPRLSWYLLISSCQVGNAGLAVAWSLGESLAVNYCQRTKTPYGRLRLSGAMSWGVYGYIIGQINEIPLVPKFVPAFLILHISVIVEILMLLAWNKDAFVMVDSAQEQDTGDVKQSPEMDSQALKPSLLDIDSTPSSLGGTLRIKPKTAIAIRDLVMMDDLTKQLKTLDRSLSNNETNNITDTIGRKGILRTLSNTQSIQLSIFNGNNGSGKTENCETELDTSSSRNDKNPQIIIFRMIMAEDGRMIKYLILFTMVGLILAPLNFVILSFDDLCKDGRCNFSELTGTVLISQAASETISFLLTPWILSKIRRSIALMFALSILIARYFFYTGWYYTANISPYWALISEWGHGAGYAICATILADVALMFAQQCKSFIPEMRRLGFLSEIRDETGKIDHLKMMAEENSIKMALRATMQAVFGSAMDGLGNGIGSLVCGIIVDRYSYLTLWLLITVVAAITAIIHQLVEVTKSRWSDSFEPKAGSKAFEIRSVTT